jgi:ribosomal protein S25
MTVELLEERLVVHRQHRQRRHTRKGNTRKGRRQAEKVAERVDVAARLVAERGCVRTSALMRELGISHSKAFYALRLLQLQNRVVEVVVAEMVAMWCRDRATAEELLMRLKQTVHRLAVENRIRYATPKKILQAALKDRDAYELLSVFIPLSRRAATFSPVALGFIRDVLHQLYGEPLKFSNNKYVYMVT